MIKWIIAAIILNAMFLGLNIADGSIWLAALHAFCVGLFVPTLFIEIAGRRGWLID